MFVRVSAAQSEGVSTNERFASLTTIGVRGLVPGEGEGSGGGGLLWSISSQSGSRWLVYAHAP